MFMYPRCPTCGSATETAETDDFDRGTRGLGQMLRLAQHQHPYLRMAHGAITIGREVYKRMPGGGEKQCTACGHRFR